MTTIRLARALRNVRRYVWDDPDKPRREKLFLFKLDCFLLTYTCLGYFCKNLAQANIDNAYVSGMKEALGMGGSELTYMGNVFTAGYVIGQIPAVILVTRVRPSLLIPTCELLWSVCTFCCSTAKTVQQMYALRFLVGVFESAYFPCIVYIIGSWYTSEERAKRVTIFYSTTTLATMFSGYLQAGAYDGLNGHLGHSGWQWLFIICGIIGLPCGLMGFWFNPDFPETTRAFYLSPAEVDFARRRLIRAGQKPLGKSSWTRGKILQIVRQWQFWVLPVTYYIVQAACPNQQPAFALWLKAEGYSVYKVNVLPTAQAGIAAAAQIAAGMISDSPLFRGRRWEAITGMQAGTFFGIIIMLIWDVPRALKFTGYYFLWIAYGVPGIYFSWFPDLIPHDHEMRGFVIAVSNIFCYIMMIWWDDAIWRTAESPRFQPGFIGAAVGSVVLVLVTYAILKQQQRDERRRSQEALDSDQQPEVTEANNDVTSV
ncbi:hypothetical protein ASPZODRAFT_155479 [Penicilliopsis zonata CBS 506.65]|uniref:Major facilitator superfamily (MFS) profile domain-containing protein n=1 Tax=Penicilliopsis zonata CBS 506.65 TaxID=1073090 RepID=A0A1L9S4V1_9EURO|nr:hypothetical protein ASPZODRAFT_155479 [Penicilliopsis zonata CBS 506.65]OJJ42187.1 hypothetical protein ASPZODRAFT_155479 [Penicilliopsis zonata CBS 506.65]